MKKSWLITLILLVCLGSSVWAQDKPKIEPLDWPVGEVELDQHHQIQVKVINTTGKPITITKARPSCECLKAKIADF